ncbi:F-box family protein with DUF295 [Prunus dulcis]|uniref:F-box family protein with DUF295 n=1 Tax=Prunus dulcis TaxID=3755 RepID=A0A5H2Y2N0_PRUDU|nr:F-box family protein with DUF295 [Prunus dulcis]
MFNMISEHFLGFSRLQGSSAKLYLGAETMIGPVVDPAGRFLETEEIERLEVRMAFGRTVDFHGRFRPIPTTEAAEVGKETSAVVCWFVWHRSRRSTPSEAAGSSAKLYLGAETMIGPVVDPAGRFLGDTKWSELLRSLGGLLLKFCRAPDTSLD